jgi:hypothetical protein
MRVRRLAFVIPLAVATVLIFGGAQSRADDTFTCPVTKIPDAPFAPPSPWLARDDWFGTQKLWTLLEPGRWVAREDPGRGYEVTKIEWWSRGYDWQKEPDPVLIITGRRLDGPSAPLIFDGVSNAYIEGRGSFMPSSVHLPTLGCWEITGHYKGTNLTFVVKVLGP